MAEPFSADPDASLPLGSDALSSRSLAVGGWSAIGAGTAGIAGLISTLPWPQLFGPTAIPGNALIFEPGLAVVLVGHYVVLAAGGALGLLSGVMFVLALRRQPAASVAALLLGAGSALLGYASTRRAVELMLNSGRSTEELATLVYTGGGILLVGVFTLTLVLRPRSGTFFVLLGLTAPTLVAAAIVAFLALGEEAFPVIWGITIPPPTDYLLAIWFIILGWSARTGTLGSTTTRRRRPSGCARP